MSTIWDISKVSAAGPGLIAARTATPAHFTIYFRDYNRKVAATLSKQDDPRENMDFIIEGPSEPGPLTCSSNLEDGSVDVTYTPLLQGDYFLIVKLFGQHIPDSPFKVSVTGESIKAHTMSMRVNVNFELEKKGIIKINRSNRVIVDVREKKIGGGLSVAMAGPKNAKVNLKMEGDSPKYVVTFSPTLPGTYLLYVKIAGENVPSSPFTLKALKELL